MKKDITMGFVIDLMTGAILFSGTVAYAAGAFAEPSTNPVFVDGQKVQLNAYLIEGRNYVQLRDVGKAVGFNVFWDGAVQIDTTSSFTGEAPTEHVDDDTNPIVNSTIFTGAFTQDAYCALRQVVNSKECSDTISVSQETFEAMQRATAAISEYPCYQMNRNSDGTAFFMLSYSAAYEEAAMYCRSFINSMENLSDREKVREIACFVCDRLTYNASKSPAPRTVLISGAVIQGNCMGYAHNFKFLCDMAGIPCIFVHSTDHQWNQVYVEGRWWHVDVCAMDAGDDTVSRQHSRVLYEDDYVQGASYQQSEPELIAFAKEVVVPGSTK